MFPYKLYHIAKESKNTNVEDLYPAKFPDLMIEQEFAEGSSKESSTAIIKLCVVRGLISDFDVNMQITMISDQTKTAIKLSLLICARRWIYAAALRH